MSAEASVQEILKSLPHRYPFLLIDKVVEWEEGKRLVAIKNVTFNEPHFQGHFPDHPVMPGVLILEAMAQASALFACRNSPNIKGNVVYLMSMDKCKFRKTVLPGHQLKIEVVLLKHRRDIWKFSCTATTEDGLATEAEIMAMTREENPGEAS